MHGPVVRRAAVSADAPHVRAVITEALVVHGLLHQLLRNRRLDVRFDVLYCVVNVPGKDLRE